MKTRNWTIVALACMILVSAGAALASDKNQADGTTTLKVKLALLEKLGTDSLHVDVDSVGGAVTLSGTVKNRETLELASTVAKSVEGASTIHNNLRLDAAVKDPSAIDAAAKEADSELKDRVLETKIRLALLDKLGLDGFEVGTETASGVVTLEFDREWNAAQRTKAMSAVRGVHGVEKVLSVDKKG